MRDKHKNHMGKHHEINLAFSVLAEMIGANSGLGFFILDSYYTFKIANMYAGIITISLIGFLLNYAFLLLEKN